MSSSLARLVRSLRLSRRQLALPPLRPSQMVTPEQLAQLDADPRLKAAGEIARAKLMRIAAEGYLKPKRERQRRRA